jgi:hypothetical protein
MRVSPTRLTIGGHVNVSFAAAMLIMAVGAPAEAQAPQQPSTYRPTQKWIANENDRAAAVENYRRYLAIGGPYAEQAREGLTRLKWRP